MKTGDYVRVVNNSGNEEIVKIKELNENEKYFLDEKNNKYSFDDIILKIDDKVNKKKQLIRLIQLDDVVNGKKVSQIIFMGKGCFVYGGEPDDATLIVGYNLVSIIPVKSIIPSNFLSRDKRGEINWCYGIPNEIKTKEGR